MLKFNKMERSAEFKFEELNDCDVNHEIKVVEVNEMKLKGRRCIDAPIRTNVISLEHTCKRQDCQGMVEYSEAPGANISPAHYEV